MCGVVAVLRRRSTIAPPDAAELAAGVEAALRTLAAGPAGLADAAAGFEALDGRLRGPAGVRVLAEHRGSRRPAGGRHGRGPVGDRRSGSRPRRRRLPLTGAELEAANAAIVRLKDAVWAIAADRLRAAREVMALAGRAAADVGDAALDAYWSVHVALSAIDRLEVRGRDSAGLHLLVTGHGLDPSDPEIAARAADPLFRSGSVRVVPDAPERPGAGLRLQGGGRDRRAGRQRPGGAGRHHRRRAPPPGPGRAPTPRSPWSATPAGPASASSARPTPTRSTAKRGSVTSLAGQTARPTWPPP